MTAVKPNRKIRRSMRKSITTISPEILEELQDAKEEAEYTQAVANKAMSDLNYLIAKTMKREKAPLSSSTICLDCGTIRSTIIPECPKCKVLNQAPQPEPEA